MKAHNLLLFYSKKNNTFLKDHGVLCSLSQWEVVFLYGVI